VYQYLLINCSKYEILKGRLSMGRGSHQITAFTMTILTVTLIVLSFFNTTVSADLVSITGTITDEKTKEPIVNATVTIYYYENMTEVTTTITDSNGYYKISELSSGDYLVKIQANEYRNESIKIKLKTDQFGVSDTYELNVHLSPISDNGGGGNVSWVTFLLGFFQIGIIITILMVISLVMYSKIKRENLLKNAVRKQIFEYIKENPGTHFRAIKNALNLETGVLQYHIDILMGNKRIKFSMEELRKIVSGVMNESVLFEYQGDRTKEEGSTPDEFDVKMKELEKGVRRRR